MITTRTQIANLALARIGARTIADYDSEQTTEAKAVRSQYDLVIDGLLRRHQWDFATITESLSLLLVNPLAEWDSAWQIPQDCVRLIVGMTSDGLPIDRFSRQGRRILTAGVSECILKYVSNAVPIADWDSLFVEAAHLKLASKIAPVVCQNPAAGAEALQELESLALPTAQTADARETLSGENFGVADLIRGSALVNSRRFRI